MTVILAGTVVVSSMDISHEQVTFTPFFTFSETTRFDWVSPVVVIVATIDKFATSDGVWYEVIYLDPLIFCNAN